LPKLGTGVSEKNVMRRPRLSSSGIPQKHEQEKCLR
jgi:hypothetical protein